MGSFRELLEPFPIERIKPWRTLQSSSGLMDRPYDVGEFVRTEPGQRFVLLDVKGKGCLDRMWFVYIKDDPNLRKWDLLIHVDDDDDGKRRITFMYQLTYRLCRPEVPVKVFSAAPDAADRAALAEIRTRWADAGRSPWSADTPASGQSCETTLDIGAGKAATLWRHDAPGTLRELRIRLDPPDDSVATRRRRLPLPCPPLFAPRPPRRPERPDARHRGARPRRRNRDIRHPDPGPHRGIVYYYLSPPKQDPPPQ